METQQLRSAVPSGVEAECFIADVSHYSACEDMVKLVKERFATLMF